MAFDRLRRLLASNNGAAFYNVTVNTGETAPNVEGMTPRALYATQANLHAVVSFLADSIAQLPLKVYVRNDENDRQRDRESAAAKLLYTPNADQTAYEFMNATAVECFLYGLATWWLLPADNESGFELRVIPREWIKNEDYETSYYAPDELNIRASGKGETITIPREPSADGDCFIQFRLYAPGNPGSYLSPVSALKQVLAEQVQADRFRSQVWRSSGRFNSYITRPKDVQPWTPEQKADWAAKFRDGWRGTGENAGSMPLLEDGMKIETYQFNSKEAQYAEAKQLSREDVAAAYHVNPALIWHTGTQTYASAKDNARALYAECLGPFLQMVQQRINSFLLPKLGAAEGTYVEFDYREKLKGNFEERASILQSAVGGPWMTRNEARADNNLPPLEGGDALVVPLNVTEGGQASPTDTHMEAREPAALVEMPAQGEVACAHVHGKKDGGETLRIKARSDADEDERLTDTLTAFFTRQKKTVLARIGADTEDWWQEDRWNAELADDLEPVLNDIADRHGKATARELKTEYDTAITRNYIRATAEWRARATNDVTKRNLDAALDADEDDEDADTPADVMDKRVNDEAPMLARSAATAMASWATIEGCHQAQAQGYSKTIEKEWRTGPNPRPSHAAMDGERVGIDEPFSNGANWPGDDSVGPEESCNCNCTTEVVITA